MAYVKCSGCGEMIEVPDEIYADELPLTEPYYCDACDREGENAVAASLGDDYEDGAERCSHCGKEIEDFSDLGCEYCDPRYFDREPS